MFYFDWGQLQQLTIDSSMQAQTNQEKIERLQEKKGVEEQEYRRQIRIFQNQHRQRVRELQKKASQKKKELEIELMISLKKMKEQLEQRTKKLQGFCQMKNSTIQSKYMVVRNKIDFQRYKINNKILEEEAEQRSLRQERPQRKKEMLKSERKRYSEPKGIGCYLQPKRTNNNQSLSLIKRIKELAQDETFNREIYLTLAEEILERQEHNCDVICI